MTVTMMKKGTTEHPMTLRVDMTPELARQLLAQNKRNRPLSSQHVIALCRKMKAGEWMLTHQGIAIDNNGQLLDGQHRLSAVVMANVTVPMLMTTGVPSAVFDAIDIDGRPRSVADLLVIRKPTSKNGTRIAAMVRAAIVHCIKGSAPHYTRQQVARCAEQLHDQADAILRATAPNADKLIPSATLAAFLNAVRADEFPGAQGGVPLDIALREVGKLGSGMWSGPGDPMMRLHTRIMKDRKLLQEAGFGVVRTKQYALGVAALRAALEDRTLTRIEESERDWTEDDGANAKARWT